MVNDRVENALQRVQGLIRTLKDALERRLNTKIRSNDPIFPWMVEWSARLITRNAKSQTSRTAHREARGHDAKARSRSRVRREDHVHGVKEHEQEWAESRCEVPRRIWLRLRMKSDESIIGTPYGVIKAKTARRLPEDQKTRDGALN